ncbi:allatostatin-A receptor-like [Amphiura filiformis]|uniref:allatostatin-A receptor-like n=1 Tax=Amphiura filiformis TaxID=82378 RepID=UPI003B21F904
MEPVLYLRIAKTIIGLFGMIGNTLVCLVIHHNHEMHTLTNALIFNQAVIDFLSCVFIFLHSNISDSGPPSSGIAGHLFCQLWNTPMALFALLVASTFSLVVLTLERYVAIVFPFHYIKLFTRTKSVILICCIWILAFSYKLPDAVRFYVKDNKCMIRQISWIKGVGIIQFSMQYLLPILVMLFAYGHIIFVLSKNQSHHDTPLDQRSTGTTAENRSINTHPESLQESIKRARRNVFKTLLLVFAAFVVCWTPNQYAFFFYNLGYNVTLGSTAYRITILMAQSNSAVNFFVYGFKYKQFRRGLRKLFRCPISIEPQTGSSYINSAT